MTALIRKDALNLREIAARVMGLECRMPKPLVRVDFSNLVTNGGFDADSDWTKGTGWTIGSGMAAQAATGGDIRQALSCTVGRTYSYKTVVDATGDTNLTNTAIQIRNSSNTVSIVQQLAAELSPNAVNNTLLSFTASESDLLVRCYSEDAVTWDNVSLWEADPADDAPWLRLPYGYRVGQRGQIVRDCLVLHPSDYTEITRLGQTFIKPLVAPGHDTEFSIWCEVAA